MKIPLHTGILLSPTLLCSESLRAEFSIIITEHCNYGGNEKGQTSLHEFLRPLYNAKVPFK